MSPIAKRNIAQFAALILLLVGGFVVKGWIGALIGFGVFVVAIFITTSSRLRRVSEAEKAERAQAQADSAREVQTVMVKAPQDHKSKGGQQRSASPSGK